MSRLLGVRLAALAVAVAAVAPAAAQLEDPAAALRRVMNGQAWTMPKRLGANGVLAVAYLDADRSRLAAVRERREAPGDPPTRTLSFYFKRGQALVETYRFTTSHAFVAMHPSEEGDRLFTTWAGGGGIATVVFGVAPGEVRVALAIPRREPEFADVDGDGELEILEPIELPGQSAPSRAHVHKWNGKEYRLLRVVPWSPRAPAER